MGYHLSPLPGLGDATGAGLPYRGWGWTVFYRKGGSYAIIFRSALSRDVAMILDKLTLRNFCLFRGQQVFDLSPVQRQGKRRPIVLFGGINGGGKTTLFDAAQLALYGGRARCSKRAGLSYDEFLRPGVERPAGPPGGPGAAALPPRGHPPSWGRSRVAVGRPVRPG